MKMSADIRVKTEKQYRTLYNELKNCIVGDMHELFFMTACIGYKRQTRKPLGKNGDPRFWSSTITPEEYSAYYAMILKNSNMELLSISDDKKVLETIEEYSNAGMELLLSEALDSYVIKVKDEYRVESSQLQKLPRTVLQYLYENV